MNLYELHKEFRCKTRARPLKHKSTPITTDRQQYSQFFLAFTRITDFLNQKLHKIPDDLNSHRSNILKCSELDESIMIHYVVILFSTFFFSFRSINSSRVNKAHFNPDSKIITGLWFRRSCCQQMVLA